MDVPDYIRFSLKVGAPFTSKSLLSLEFASRTKFRIMSNVERSQATAVRLSRYEDDEREK